eukprot:14405763-Alexandrium_andersonii.AAC.1
MPPADSRIDISNESPALMDSVWFFGYAPDMCGARPRLLPHHCLCPGRGCRAPIRLEGPDGR